MGHHCQTVVGGLHLRKTRVSAKIRVSAKKSGIKNPGISKKSGHQKSRYQQIPRSAAPGYQYPDFVRVSASEHHQGKTPSSCGTRGKTVRWSTTLSSEVHLPDAIDLRALCGANLVTLRSKLRGHETLGIHRVGRRWPSLADLPRRARVDCVKSLRLCLHGTCPQKVQ